MARQKKIKSLQIEKEKIEVHMTEEAVLESINVELDLARVELEKVKLEIEEKRKELSTRREIAQDEIKIIEKQITNINKSKSQTDVIERQKAIDNEKVTGRFMNRRNPGQSIKLPYHKYVDDPVVWHTFYDGQIKTIPRGFADQINEYYHTPVFIQKQGQQPPSSIVGENSAISEVDTSNKKYAFVAVGFAA